MSCPRSCIHCKTLIGMDDGFHFGINLELICDHCGKIAYPTTWQTEQDVDTAIRTANPPAAAVSQPYNYNHNPTPTPVTNSRTQPIALPGTIKRYPPSLFADSDV